MILDYLPEMEISSRVDIRCLNLIKQRPLSDNGVRNPSKVDVLNSMTKDNIYFLYFW